MANISIDAAKARHWKLEVTNELHEVRTLLNKVGEFQEEAFDADDPVMKLMEDTAKTMTNVWKELDKGFSAIPDTLEKIIKGYENVVADIEDGINTVKANIGL